MDNVLTHHATFQFLILRMTHTMKRTALFDAIVFATLTGLILSSVIGCASVDCRTLAESMRPEYRQIPD